jgi:hypothetical protein
MSDAFTFKLGNLDLSEYLRIGDGNTGLDPYDTDGFVDPQFGTSPFAEGQPLVLPDIQNRMGTWPLNLSGYSKDFVHGLVRDINNEIATRKPLRIEWRDSGASESTFYDVSFARFDPEFNYRRAAQNWEMGVLRTWAAPPYGHTGTYRIAGTRLSPSSVAFTVPVASIIGDAPAQTDVRISCGTGQVPEHGRIGIVAEIPHPSYAFLIPAGSLIPASGYNNGIAAASGGIGSQCLTAGKGFNEDRSEMPWFTLALSPATVYAGKRHRIFGLARGFGGQEDFPNAIGVFRGFQGGRPLDGVATHVPSAAEFGQWGLVDLGVISVPTVPLGPTITADFLRSINPYGTSVQFGMRSGAMAAGGVVTGMLEVNSVIVTPEDNSQVLLDSGKRSLAVENFNYNNKTDGATTAIHNSYDLVGNRLFTPTILYDGGGISLAGGVGPVADFFRGPFGVGGYAAVPSQTYGFAVDCPPIVDMHIEEYTYLINPGSGAFQALGKMDRSPTQARYLQGRINGSQMQIWGFGVGGFAAGTYLLTSINTTVWGSTTDLEFKIRGDQVTFAAKAYASLLASVGAIASMASFPGVPFSLHRQGVPGTLPRHHWRGFRVTESPSQAIGAADVLRFSPEGVQVYSSASAPLRDVTHRTRGRAVTLGPSSAAVGIVALGADGGRPNDILSAEVRVRERFQFAR